MRSEPEKYRDFMGVVSVVHNEMTVIAVEGSPGLMRSI